MFYGNKTKNTLSGFSTTITSGEDILSISPGTGEEGHVGVEWVVLVIGDVHGYERGGARGPVM